MLDGSARSCTYFTVWDFISLVESSCSSNVLPLVARKMDRKKERSQVFSVKQYVMDSMRMEAVASHVLLYGIVYEMFNTHGYFVDLPLQCSASQLHIILSQLYSFNERHNKSNDAIVILIRLYRLVFGDAAISHNSLEDIDINSGDIDVAEEVKRVVLRNSKK